MVDAQPITVPSVRVAFVIHGKPPVKRRVRFANGRTYNPAANRADDKRVWDAYAAASTEQYGAILAAPNGAPVTVCIRTTRALPKNVPASVTEQPDTGHAMDADNIAKAILDGLQGENMAIPDDSQVTRLYAEKRPRVHQPEDVTEVTVSWGDEQSYLR